MLLQFITNRWVLMVICSLLVFGEMFVAKKWFTKFTEKIKDETARVGANQILGLATCFALAAAQMYALCDVLNAVFYWRFVIAAAIGANFLYLMLEKVFGDSKVKALGEAFCEFVSHSDMFDGELSKQGVVSIAQKLLNITTAIDKKEAAKEAKTVDEVVSALEGILKDGKITKEEEAQATELIKKAGNGLAGNSTYEKYKALLNR